MDAGLRNSQVRVLIFKIRNKRNSRKEELDMRFSKKLLLPEKRKNVDAQVPPAPVCTVFTTLAHGQESEGSRVENNSQPTRFVRFDGKSVFSPTPNLLLRKAQYDTQVSP